MEPLNSFNLFNLSCTTFGIIFNLLKAVCIWKMQKYVSCRPLLQSNASPAPHGSVRCRGTIKLIKCKIRSSFMFIFCPVNFLLLQYYEALLTQFAQLQDALQRCAQCVVTKLKSPKKCFRFLKVLSLHYESLLSLKFNFNPHRLNRVCFIIYICTSYSLKFIFIDTKQLLQTIQVQENRYRNNTPYIVKI